MKTKFLLLAAVAFSLGTVIQTSSAAANTDAAVKTAGSVSYVSGGVGTESIDRLNSLAGQFNVKFVFAMQSGEYVSAVRVAISDARGESLLTSTADGPWFMARLPPGNYRIAATLGEKTMSRQFAVESGKLRTIDFRWGAE